MRKIHPVILSGGTGSRLWPLSRQSFPKQLLPLIGPQTMLQQTARRVEDESKFHPLTVIANVEHRFVIAEQLQHAGARVARIVLEPVARNTAAAIATAALLALQDDDEALLLVMPADHAIPDLPEFVATVLSAVEAARQGALTLFGIPPDSPATCYGYIKPGRRLCNGVRRVAEFAEKPDRARAQTYVGSGEYLWNSGVFLLPARGVVAELERHEPELLAAVRGAIAEAIVDLDFLRLDAKRFSEAPSISFDHAILERTDRAAVVPSRFRWSDVGAWSALWELGEGDCRGNVLLGEVVAQDTTGSYVRSDGPLIAAVGVEDLIIVATPDAVLVTRRGADQEVKLLVEKLRASNHAAATQTRRVHRPWGWYEGLHSGERFQVKRITVNPGGKLSLQKHMHRAEHWVVVTGTADVEVNGGSRLVTENESVYIPLGAIHRLSNPGVVPLNLIEVQSGAYLGEDDILRLEDAYMRS